MPQNYCALQLNDAQRVFRNHPLCLKGSLPAEAAANVPKLPSQPRDVVRLLDLRPVAIFRVRAGCGKSMKALNSPSQSKLQMGFACNCAVSGIFFPKRLLLGMRSGVRHHETMPGCALHPFLSFQGNFRDHGCSPPIGHCSVPTDCRGPGVSCVNLPENVDHANSREDAALSLSDSIPEAGTYLFCWTGWISRSLVQQTDLAARRGWGIRLSSRWSLSRESQQYFPKSTQLWISLIKPACFLMFQPRCLDIHLLSLSYLSGFLSRTRTDYTYSLSPSQSLHPSWLALVPTTPATDS